MHGAEACSVEVENVQAGSWQNCCHESVGLPPVMRLMKSGRNPILLESPKLGLVRRGVLLPLATGFFLAKAFAAIVELPTQCFGVLIIWVWTHVTQAGEWHLFDGQTNAISYV